METQIEQIAAITSGYQSRAAIEPDPNGTHLLVQLGDFNEARTILDLSDPTRISPGKAAGRSLKTGDVLFLSKGTRNFGYFVETIPENTIPAGHFFTLSITDDRVLPQFLAWSLNQEPALRHFARTGTASTAVQVVNRQALATCPISIPPLESQRMILEMHHLSLQRERLLTDLIAKQNQLTTAACQRALTA